MAKWFEDGGLNSDIVLSTRIRLARNLKGIPYPGKMTAEDAKKVISLVEAALEEMNYTFTKYDLQKLSDIEKEKLVEEVTRRLFIPLEASGRHVHVTGEQARQLFGHGLTPKRPLSQPGQFLAKERVTVMGPKGKFDNVAVLGPERKEAQVEVSLTDARTLGLQPPVRPSGDVSGSPGAVLIGPKGQVTLSRGVIAAQRHIHMNTRDAEKMGIRDKQVVRLQTFGHRGTVFGDVLVRVSPDFATAAHLDYDEANTCGFAAGDLG